MSPVYDVDRTKTGKPKQGECMGEIQYEKAYEGLRKRLISQSIKPGERLTEQVLADELKVNRGDIRQAFSRLLAEGLVVRGERGGVFAREYTAEYLKEMAETRMALETAAAALAVERVNEDDLASMREILDHMEIMAENGYEMGFNETDLRFHEQLVKSAHNERFYHIYRLANVPLTFLVLEKAPFKGREEEEGEKGKREKMKEDALAHREILNALKRRDKETLIGLLVRGMSGNN